MIIAQGSPTVGRDDQPVHVPVLVAEVLEVLAAPAPEESTLDGQWVIDATVGAGGHTRAILEAFPGVRVLGLDQDPQILEQAAQTLRSFGDRVRLVNSRFSNITAAVEAERIGPLAAILADLGASSLQLDRPERGFSFQADGVLDMRMDPSRERTAADIVNTWDEEDLADLFYFEGGETRSRRIARAIVEARRRTPFKRTLGLAEVIAASLGGRSGKTHPCTRAFQALRRAVNEEGEELLTLLESCEELLPDGGRLAVISFHSGEDADVKRFFGQGARTGNWDLLTKRPLRGGDAEVRQNRRARTARLRAAVRRREDAEEVS